MKVFVSPPVSAVQYLDDFCCTIEDELVCLWNCPCDCDSCPKLMFSGLESHRATSVAAVAERADVDVDVLEEMMRRDLIARGWADAHLAGEPVDDELGEWARHLAREVASFAGYFEVGSIVERSAEGVDVRLPDAA